jgi:hypothetical protein
LQAAGVDNTSPAATFPTRAGASGGSGPRFLFTAREKRSPMDPRVESAIRRACDQLGREAEAFLAVVREHLKSSKLHPDVKLEKRRSPSKEV